MSLEVFFVLKLTGFLRDMSKKITPESFIFSILTHYSFKCLSVSIVIKIPLQKFIFKQILTVFYQQNRKKEKLLTKNKNIISFLKKCKAKAIKTYINNLVGNFLL